MPAVAGAGVRALAAEFDRRVSGWRVLSCRLLHVRYRRGTGLTSAYRLQVRNGGRSAREVLALRKCVSASAAEELGRQWEGSATTFTPVGDRGWLDDAEGLAVWFLPGEPGLAGLPLAFDPRRVLLRAAPLREDATPRAPNFRAEVRAVRYEPERSCLLRTPASLAIEVGVYHDPEEACRALRAERCIADLLRGEALWVPPVLRSEAEPHALYRRVPPGKPLLQGRGRLLAEALRSIAGLLARLHREGAGAAWPAGGAGAVDVAGPMETARGILDGDPLAARLARLWADMEDLRAALPEPPLSCRLGRLDPAQVILTASGAALPAAADAGRGDPHGDVASFEAETVAAEATGGLDPALGWDIRRLFLGRWRNRVGSLFSPAMHLVRRAEWGCAALPGVLAAGAVRWRDGVERVVAGVEADLGAARRTIGRRAG